MLYVFLLCLELSYIGGNWMFFANERYHWSSQERSSMNEWMYLCVMSHGRWSNSPTCSSSPSSSCSHMCPALSHLIGHVSSAIKREYCVIYNPITCSCFQGRDSLVMGWRTEPFEVLRNILFQWLAISWNRVHCASSAVWKQLRGCSHADVRSHISRKVHIYEGILKVLESLR